jgi:hypothetical protein
MKTRLKLIARKASTRLTPDLFRFGASTLVNDVLMQIAKQVDGNYQGADYFSLP